MRAPTCSSSFGGLPSRWRAGMLPGADDFMDQSRGRELRQD